MAQASLDRQDAAERRFEEYLEAIGSVLGHADRRPPVHAYCTGLLLPSQRKSLEPMAARVAPGQAQQLHHFVSTSPWPTAPLEEVLVQQANELMGGPRGDA